MPDPIAALALRLDADVAADVVDAERALERLNVEASSLVNTETLARLLLRAESVASSRIEGLQIGARRLLRAEAARESGADPGDVTASEVLANIDAMVFAIESTVQGSSIAPSVLLEVHRRLLAGKRHERHGGVVRRSQNWIGGSAYNPCSAAYVPPPPEFVDDLLADLARFCNRDDLPAVAQAAVAHAQFETIHPFADGNGRTGRALIHMVLRRRGVAGRVLPPVSLILATWAADYVDGLTTFRYLGEPDSTAAHAGANRWIGRFAAACTRAVADAHSFEHRSRELEAGWRSTLGTVRTGSAVDLLLRALPAAPMLTVTGAATLINRSFTAANAAIERLAAHGVLEQVTVGRRNRAWEAPGVIAAFTDLERRLASPDRG